MVLMWGLDSQRRIVDITDITDPTQCSDFNGYWAKTYLCLEMVQHSLNAWMDGFIG